MAIICTQCIIDLTVMIASILKAICQFDGPGNQLIYVPDLSSVLSPLCTHGEKAVQIGIAAFSLGFPSSDSLVAC